MNTINVRIDETGAVEAVPVEHIATWVGRGIYGHAELLDYASRYPKAVFAGSRDTGYNAAIRKPECVVLHSYMVN